jgi:hypothetical protein
MLTISKPLSASQVRTYHEREFASERQNYWSRVPTQPKTSHLSLHKSAVSKNLLARSVREEDIMRHSGMIVAVLALSAIVQAQSAVPPGTLIPASLSQQIKASSVHPGQQIRARIMQDIPGTSIHRGAHLLGHVVRAETSKNGPARLEITFDNVLEHGRRIPIRSNLRTMASFFEVEQAQIPEEMSSRGLTPETWTTQQIGGDQVYRGGGPVAVGDTVVGRPLPYGVVGLPLGQAGQKCRGQLVGNTSPQAFWLFSTNACGVYGFPNIRVEHAGRTDPQGTIILTAQNGKLELNSGSALLLRVQGSEEPRS